MIRRIEVLPDVLINQIAAGEVVDRPAAVVKELVENALDAGATHISVEFEKGGKRRIRILDNGVGMTKESAQLALQRHATSKLRCVDDLFAMQTFGFRGEALPSIASVSKLTLTTRERSTDAQNLSAHRLVVQGGRVEECVEVGAPVGTCIEVCDLLYNVPARQKFLKGEGTESSHIRDIMNKLALAHPNVHFRLKNQNRTMLDAPGHENYGERVRCVMGARLGDDCQEVEGEYGGVRVRAFLGDPKQAQSTTRGLQIFVGKRAIRDRGVLKAILQGYDELIPAGRYPTAVLLIDTPAADVDVNVHPQKLEVRFADPQLVFAAVRQVVRQGTRDAGWTHLPSKRTYFGASEAGRKETQSPTANTSATLDFSVKPQPASALAVRYAKEHAKQMLPWSKKKKETKEVDLRESSFPSDVPVTPVRPKVLQTEGPMFPCEKDLVDIPDSNNGMAQDKIQSNPSEPVCLSGIRYVGQLYCRYLLCEGDEELLVMDQSVAFHWLEQENLRAKVKHGQVNTQQLLFPQTLALNETQAKAAVVYQSILVSLGFELEEFGTSGKENHYALRAVPVLGGKLDFSVILEELLDTLVAQEDTTSQEERLDSLLFILANHSAVEIGQPVEPSQAKNLLARLEAGYKESDNKSAALFIRFGIKDIEKQLGSKKSVKKR